MKRLLLLLSALLLLLGGCAKEKTHTFAVSSSGYVDTETDTCYVMLDMPYEAGAYGDEVGRYVNEKRGTVKMFYAIPGLDTALFLTDTYTNVYYAGSEPIDAALWTIDRIYFCEEDVLSVEKFRFAANGEEQDTLLTLRDLWFEGQSVPLPIEAPTRQYAVKLTTKAYENLCYGILFVAYDDGSAYLCDKQSDRAVALGDALLEAIEAKED